MEYSLAIRLYWVIAAAVATACVLAAWLGIELLAGATASEMCWKCPDTLRALAGVVMLAVVQQILLAALTVIAIPQLRVSSKWTEVFAITVVSSCVNAVAPAKAGTVLKATMLDRIAGVEWRSFSGAHLGITLISLATTAAVALVAGAALVGRPYVYVSAGMLAILFATVALASSNRWPTFGFPGGFVHEAGKSLRETLGLGSVVAIAVICLTALMVTLVRVRLLMTVLDIQIPWQHAGFIAVAVTISPLFAILPGGAGTRELSFAGVAAALGVGKAVALGAALLDRGFGTLVVVLLAGPALLWLRPREPTLST